MRTQAQIQIDELSDWMLANCLEEFGNYGEAPCGESAVEMAIRLLETAKEQHLLSFMDITELDAD